MEAENQVISDKRLEIQALAKCPDALLVDGESIAVIIKLFEIDFFVSHELNNPLPFR